VNLDVGLSYRLSENVSLGKKSTRVQPLWWTNPNNYVYSEMNKPTHMKLPKTVLPEGAGVLDYKDKELLTPQKCFPVIAVMKYMVEKQDISESLLVFSYG
jgi:hypothetical protein